MGCCSSKGRTEDEKQQNASGGMEPKPEVTVTSKSDDEKKSPEYSSTSAIDRMDNRITVHVLQARHLLGMDSNGSCDPYVKVTFTSRSNPNKPLEQSRTRVIRKNRSPVWNDTVACEGVGVIRDCLSITLEVWDHDIAKKDDFLAQATLTGIEGMRGPALPVWLPLKDKNNKDSGEIQVEVSVAEDSNTLTIRDWTHVLELTIGEGVDLEKMSWFKKGHSKPYVRMEWGTQVLHTSKLKNTKECHWNEKGFLFVHEKNNAHYYLQITVMEDTAKREGFGQGVVSAQKNF